MRARVGLAISPTRGRARRAHTQTAGDLVALLEACEPDVVLNAVVGFAGLPATMWALEHGVTLALANKESLVAAGALALARPRARARACCSRSTASTRRSCSASRATTARRSTGSSSPRPAARSAAARATSSPTSPPTQALAHPTWRMGTKITVDSATLANKGLELIEAHFLFDLPYDRIEVVVHPGSIVHGLVRFRDGAALAHLGYPDMRVPISYALTYPGARGDAGAAARPRGGLTLEFEAPDLETFPLLRLAREAGEAGGTAPCAYNAANEVAVEAFLDGRLGFLGIAEVVERTLVAADISPADDLDALTEADAARPRRWPPSSAWSRPA